MHYFSLDRFSFGGLLEYILQHALAKFQPATTCNSQNTSQNTQKHQNTGILLSKPVALYICGGGIGRVMRQILILVLQNIFRHGLNSTNSMCSESQVLHLTSIIVSQILTIFLWRLERCIAYAPRPNNVKLWNTYRMSSQQIARMSKTGICIQWTGVLDWSAGMEYWNGITGTE